MCSDSEKNMSAFAEQNHAPSLTYVRLELSYPQYTLIQCLNSKTVEVILETYTINHSYRSKEFSISMPSAIKSR